MTLSKQTSLLTFWLPVPFPLSHFDWMCGLALPRGTVKGSIYTRYGVGGQRRKEEKEHVRRTEMYMCVCVVISEHMCRRWLLYDHTPTGACECPLADRHTHVARWECWETDENAILLTDMPKHTTCNHFKDVFLWVSTSNCFKQMSDLWPRVCNLLDAGWAGGQSEWESERDTDRGRRSLKASMRLTSISYTPPHPSPVLLWLLSVLCLPWAVKTAW